MRILVVEDSPIHRRSAEITLAGHDVTFATTFSEAENLLDPCDENLDEGKLLEIMREDGWNTADEWAFFEEEEWLPYWRSLFRAHKKACPSLPFDAVLTDMMLPLSEDRVSLMGDSPGSQALGFAVALKAASRGARFVALLTDADHHQSAISLSLELIGPERYPKLKPPSFYHFFEPNFVINGCHAMFVHAPMTKIQLEDGEEEVYAKDWGRALRDLVARAETEPG